MSSCSHPLRIIFLGTSAAVSSPERDNTSILINAGGSFVLIDCCGSPQVKLGRVGVDPLSIEAIVITHSHVDHLYGLPSLIHSMVMLGRTTPLHLFCPQECLPAVGSLLDVFSLRHKASFLWLSGVSPEGGEFYRTGEIVLGALFAVHNTPAMGIQISYGERNIVYSGDTAPSEAILEAASRADLLIHECTFESRESQDHTNLMDIKKIVKQAAPGRTVLVHFSAEDDFSRWEETLGEESVNVVLAHDFMEVEV